MRQRKVVLTAQTIDDLQAIHSYIELQAGSKIADGYIERLKSFIRGFDLASERGIQRSDIFAGLRIVGFEKRVTIGFVVDQSTVQVLRIFWSGRDWEHAF